MPPTTIGVSSTANGASNTDVSSNSPNAAAHSSNPRAVHAYTTVSKATSSSATRPISNASTASSSVRGRSSRPVVTTNHAVLGVRPTVRQFGASSITTAHDGGSTPAAIASPWMRRSARSYEPGGMRGGGAGGEPGYGQARTNSSARCSARNSDHVKTPALDATPKPALT